MKILGSIVHPLPCHLTPFVTDFFHRGTIGAKAICNNLNWIAVTLHRFLQEFQCGLAITFLRHECLKNFTLMIDSPPQIMSLAIDPNEDLVQMPFPLWKIPSRRNPFLSDLCGEHRAKPVPPGTYRFITDVNPALMQQVFNLT